MKLNEQQQKAVDFREGYSFVTAVPGSGKTRILTQRAISILGDGTPPEQLLCVTFTNKAAREMKKRIGEQVSAEVVKKLWVSTFHSMGAKILRREIHNFPVFDKDFTIVDTKDQLMILERGAESLGYIVKGRKSKDGIDLRNVLAAIGEKKDKLLTDDQFKGEYNEQTVNLFFYYKDYLIKTNCLDFGDLLYLFYKLLKHKKSVAKKYARRFKYIMVDECQDLNFCQYEIVKILASEHENLMLIGDVDQSIYRFRQADPKHVFTYIDEHDVVKLPLSYNYRSTKKILKCAEAVIKHNNSRVAESLDTTNPTGEDVNLICFEQGINESKWLADEVKWLTQDGSFKYSEIAILYRTNAFSRAFEQSLRMRHIPCKVIGGRSFFDMDIVRVAINYLQFYDNPNNVLSFCKIINKPRRSIAEEIVRNIEEYCFEHGCDLVEALGKIDDINIKKIGAKRKAHLHQFRYALEHKPEDDSMGLFGVASRIFEDSGYRAYVDGLDDDDEGKTGRSSSSAILDSFMDMLVEWDKQKSGSLSDLLEFINLQSSSDDDSGEDSVKLMTIHTSKGLEFPVVFIVGAEEGSMPHNFSIETHDPEDIEEERRLFYVAMTRAERKLYITNAVQRYMWGKPVIKKPSRFVKEMKKSGAVMVQRRS